jgi:hypothetical protein
MSRKTLSTFKEEDIETMSIGDLEMLCAEAGRRIPKRKNFSTAVYKALLRRHLFSDYDIGYGIGSVANYSCLYVNNGKGKKLVKHHLLNADFINSN